MRLSSMISIFASMVTGTAVPEVSSTSPQVAGLGQNNASLEENALYAVLPKTVVSSNLRLVLAVGLEGTGHGYFCEVDDQLFDNNPDLTRLPSQEYLDVGRFRIRSSMGITAQHYSDLIDDARTAMRTVAEVGSDLPFPGTMMLMHGWYSYPDGVGKDKALRYLDLRLLAEVAEAEGVDFRVVYLRRSVKDMLVANTVHRQFQNTLGLAHDTDPEQSYMAYMQVLITDIAVVHSFLAEIDPAFVICHDFAHAGEIEQSALIADFIAPNVDFAVMLNHSLVEVARGHGSSTEELPYDAADVVAARLQRKINALESTVCTGVR